MRLTSLVPIILLVIAFYFLILRPQKKRQQAVEATQRSLEPGDRVLLSSGIFATVVSLGVKQAVLELAPGVELTVLKQAIARKASDADEDVITDELEDTDDDIEPLAEAEPVTHEPGTPETLRPEQPRSAGADTSRLT